MVRIFPEALWHVYISRPRAPGLQSIVQYIAFRYRDLKEGRDGAHLLPVLDLTSVRSWEACDIVRNIGRILYFSKEIYCIAKILNV